MLMDHQLFCLKIEKVKSYMLMISLQKHPQFKNNKEAVIGKT